MVITRNLHADIQEVLITAEEIQKRVAELGEAISRDYEGKDPLLVGVLRALPYSSQIWSGT
jgi:hypoxanthine phosphoribosyltransferase